MREFGREETWTAIGSSAIMVGFPSSGWMLKAIRANYLKLDGIVWLYSGVETDKATISFRVALLNFGCCWFHWTSVNINSKSQCQWRKMSLHKLQQLWIISCLALVPNNSYHITFLRCLSFQLPDERFLLICNLLVWPKKPLLVVNFGILQNVLPILHSF